MVTARPAFLLALLALIGLCETAAEANPSHRPGAVIDVRRAIELAKPTIPWTQTNDGAALFSPDGSRFILAVKQENVGQNTATTTIWLYPNRVIDGRAAPVGHVLFRRTVDYDTNPTAREPIYALQWIRQDTLCFLALGHSEKYQVFCSDLNGIIREVTRSEENIWSFATNGTTTVWWSEASRRDSSQFSRVLTGASLVDAFPPPAGGAFASYDLFVSRTVGAAPARLLSGIGLGVQSLPLWLSPDGSHLIFLHPSIDAPSNWNLYQIQSGSGLAKFYEYAPQYRTSDASSPLLQWRTRFMVADLTRLRVTSALNAPTGEGIYSGVGSTARTPVTVVWSADSASAALINTFVPLGENQNADLNEAARSPAIIGLEIDTGKLQVVGRTTSLNAGRISQLTAVDLTESGRAILSWSDLNRPSVRQILTYEDGSWQLSNPTPQTPPQHPIVTVSQGMNARPIFTFKLNANARAHPLLDPDISANEITFARAIPFSWMDRHGRRWRGSLTLPVGYIPSRRYPLVVQTHGFNPNEFLLTGPSGFGTAMSAQAFAGAGIAVLQVDHPGDAMSMDNREADTFAEGYRSGVAAAISAGYADENRIGIIAFSRTGLSVIKLLAEEPDMFRAATIADAAWYGYVNQLILRDSAFAADMNAVAGQPPDYENLPSWFARDPLYALQNTRAAIRIESNGGNSPLGLVSHWELYRVLRDSGRPVDFIYFPFGDHVLQRPIEQFISQSGNVDWFRFWLLNEADEVDTKREQYARWESLRTSAGY